MEESHFFALLGRMKYIQRWSLMRNTEVENLQGHSLETAMIAHQLGVLRNTYFEGHIDVNRLAVLAMYHDVSEVFTGDMPTPRLPSFYYIHCSTNPMLSVMRSKDFSSS